MALEYLMLELKMGGKKEDIKSIFNAVSKWKNCIKLTLFKFTVDRIDQTLYDQYL